MDLYSLQELYNHFSTIAQTTALRSLYAAVGVDASEQKAFVETLATAISSSSNSHALVIDVAVEQLPRELASKEFFPHAKILVIHIQENSPKISLEQLQQWHLQTSVSSASVEAPQPISLRILLFFFRSLSQQDLLLFFREHGLLFRPKAISLAERVEWLVLLARQLQLKVSKQVLTYLVEQIGNHSLLLQSELEKMATYAMGCGNILTLESCQQLICSLELPAPWKLGEALIEKRTIAAITAWRELMALGVDLILLNRQLRGFLYNEFQIALLYHSQGREGLLTAMPKLAGSWNERRIIRAQQAGVHHLYRLVTEIDRQLLLLKNSSSYAEGLFMEQFIFQNTL